jgi:4-hydroxy-tetrahydrodipicolinate synthase
VRLLGEGKTTAALRVFSDRILPFIHLFGMGDEVQNTKALFHHLGIFRSGEVRPPLLPCRAERLREVVLAYDLCQSAEGA